MTVSDNGEFEKYKAEAQQKWGETHAYTEYSEKAANYSENKQALLAEGMNSIMKSFAQCMKNGNTPDSEEAQNLVKTLREYITGNYYTCDKNILAGLGQMYSADERFKRNIDAYGGGTAEFIGKAIEAYCAE